MACKHAVHQPIVVFRTGTAINLLRLATSSRLFAHQWCILLQASAEQNHSHSWLQAKTILPASPGYNSIAWRSWPAHRARGLSGRCCFSSLPVSCHSNLAGRHMPMAFKRSPRQLPCSLSALFTCHSVSNCHAEHTTCCVGDGGNYVHC